VATSGSHAHRVLLQQIMWQPYRTPLARCLRERDDLDVTAAYGLPQPGKALEPGDVSGILPVVALRNYYIGRPAVAVIQRGFVREVRSRRYDAVIAAMDPRIVTNLLAREVARRLRIAWVWWGHGIRPRGRFRRLYAWMARDADSTILYSEEGRQQLVAAGAPADRLFVAPNGLDTEAAAVLRRNVPFEERTDVLYVGRLIPAKRVEVLVEGFRLALPRLRSDTRLVIVGDGPERERLGRLALSLGDRVVFVPGTYDDAELAQHYGRAWVAVSPDKAGLSVMQSLGYGVPFVLTKGAMHGPEAAVIEHGVNGIWCDRTGSEALADTLVCLCADRARASRMGTAGVETVERRFSVRAMAEGLAQAVHCGVVQRRSRR